MMAILFGWPEAVTIRKKDRVLRAQAAKEELIEKARREGELSRFEVWIEPELIDRSVIVEAYSEEEAEEIAEREHLEYGETISAIRKKTR